MGIIVEFPRTARRGGTHANIVWVITRCVPARLGAARRGGQLTARAKLYLLDASAHGTMMT